MDSLLVTNLKSLIVFVHLSGLAFGIGGAWILDLYILRKMHKSPITNENIQIITFVSKVVVIGLALLWLSGLSFIVFYNFVQPELLLNHKIWAKAVIVIVLTMNGYYLHKMVIPVIVNNQNKVLIRAVNLRQVNILTLVGCISFISWPFAMFLGTFKSINFTFSFLEIISTYFAVLLFSLAVAFILKSYLMEKEMGRKIRVLNEHLSNSNEKLFLHQQEIKVLTKVLKKANHPRM
jgi:hypothetical protein